MHTASCVSKPELARFVQGDLDAEQLDRVAAHVDDCVPCQDTVFAIAERSDTFVDAVQAAGARIPAPRENALKLGLERMLASLRIAPANDAADTLAGLPAEIGPYRIEEQLGAGGMGHVYRATHTKLKRTVALKLLPANRWSSTPAVSRFEREMEAIGGLDHPHIVRASDAGEAQGMQYLVMEYIDGLDLSRLVNRLGPLPLTEACALARQCAIGLHHAHENGLVHRDIKPSNLMLAVDRSSDSTGSSKPTLKILDLGLALLGDERLQEGHEITTVGTLMGTLDYMSPEQGIDSHSVDQRTDVYSLGATLFKLLTGLAPYADPQFSTLMKKMTALATKPAPSIGSVRTDLPEKLIQVIDRMLSRDPDERFQNASEVADALAPFASGAVLGELLSRGMSTADPIDNANWQIPATAFAMQTATIQRDAPPVNDRGRTTYSWLTALAAGFLAISAGILFYLATDLGELSITSDDPNATVLVKRADKTIKTIRIENGEKKLHLRVGNYDLVVTGDANVSIEPKAIAIRRGAKEAARVATRLEQPTFRPGSKLLLTVPGCPPEDDLDGDYTITKAGELILPSPFGKVNVQGLTIRAAETAVTDHLAKYLKSPQAALTYWNDKSDDLLRMESQLPGLMERARNGQNVVRTKMISRAETLHLWPVINQLNNQLEKHRQQYPVENEEAQNVLEQEQAEINALIAQVNVSTIDEFEAEVSRRQREYEQAEVHKDRCLADYNALLDQVRSERLMLPKSATPGVIRRGDRLLIEVLGTTPERPIKGIFGVEHTGAVALGPGYRRVNVLGLEFQEAEFAIRQQQLKELNDVEVMVTSPRKTTGRPDQATEDESDEFSAENDPQETEEQSFPDFSIPARTPQEQARIEKEVDVLNKEAKFIRDAGDIHAAIAKYNDAIAIAGNFESLYEKGKLLREVGWTEEAIKTLTEAGAFTSQIDDPERRVAWIIELGRAYSDGEQYNTAINCFASGLSQPGMSLNAELWFNKAVAQAAFAQNQQFATREAIQADAKKALESFDRALQLKPDYAEARLERDKITKLLSEFRQLELERHRKREELMLDEKKLASLSENVTRLQNELRDKHAAVKSIEQNIADATSSDENRPNSTSVEVGKHRELSLIQAQLRSIRDQLQKVSSEYFDLLQQVRTDRLELYATANVIGKNTRLLLDVEGVQPEAPIRGVFLLEPSGTIHLGPAYGRVAVSGLTFEEAEFVIRTKLLSQFNDPKVMATTPRGDDAVEPSKSAEHKMIKK